MNDKNDQSPPPPTERRRRSSFAGLALADMFGRSRPSETPGRNSPPGQGPIVAAAAEATRRRMSISTMGMSASPNQSSPVSARLRRESISSAGVGSLDESAVEDEPTSATAPNSGHFGRRVSFGARALKDMKGGAASSVSNEGFNWADNMRTRAERGSIAGISGSPPAFHARAKSIAVMDHPVRDQPKPVNVPDQFQERILKGDFYMD